MRRALEQFNGAGGAALEAEVAEAVEFGVADGWAVRWCGCFAGGLLVAGAADGAVVFAFWGMRKVGWLEFSGFGWGEFHDAALSLISGLFVLWKFLMFSLKDISLCLKAVE
jgi:hypothetical protein